MVEKKGPASSMDRRDEPSVARDRTSGARRLAQGAAVPTGARYSCLVVEDSPMMRQLVVLALSRVKNLHVTEADDGVDGLRKLATGRFDIIISDINMPIMDGLKLVKRVRSDPVHKDVPIIIITTEGSSEDRQRALLLGANAYIVKPIQAPQVIAKVRELLKIDPPTG
jgi:two-component system chemotaxis response regulator CheY